MDYSKFHFLKKCEAELYDRLFFILDDFTSEIDTKIIVLSDTLSWIELYFTNLNKSRTIQIIISEGINADNKQSYSIKFNIQKINSERELISSFSISDFCTELKLPIEFKDIFTDTPKFLTELENYLEKINTVIETEKMKSILFLDNWIDIKPNLFPYK